MSRPRALVSAGGTSEPVDDVRILTNRSTGRFGAAIANALAALGVEVTLLASRAMLARGIELAGSIRQVPYESSGELGAALDAALAEGPDLVFMAAAVSDYAPEVSAGKLSSSAEERSLRLVRTPKLLDRLRGACPRAFLIGFKLLSGVSREELTGVARGQLERARLDLVVANDLQELGGATHPVLLVDASSAERITGPRAQVAEALARAALARAKCPVETFGPRPAPSGVGLAWGGPALQLGAALTLRSDEPLAEALARAAAAGRYAGPPCALSRGGQEWVLCAAPPPPPAWDPAPGWDALSEVLGAPRQELPLLEGHHRRGLLARGPRGQALAAPLPGSPREAPVWVEALLEALSGEAALWVLAGCEALLEARGYLPSEEPTCGAYAAYRGPATRDDAKQGASLCLFAPLGRRVLLGRRTKAPALGEWAFPGGGREPGETPWETARRELEEETGLVHPGAPAGQRVVFHGEGGALYRVDGFLGLTLSEGTPAGSGELSDLGWFELSAALALSPMTPGTRRVLRELEAGILPTP